jgi:hypothetical protein
MFPPSTLAQLFVKGSLKNTAMGFEFKLRNVIDSGTLTGMGPLVVDDTTYQPAQYMVTASGREMTADRMQPVYTWPGMEATVSVEGAPLAPGDHQITVQAMTAEAGRLQFSVTVPLSE